MFFLNTSKTYEPEIIINPNTRKIDIPEELYNIGVVADDNAEMVNIRIPRYFDGCDLSTRRCTISYNNALKERGVYTVNEIKIENDSLLLSWYISKFVTKKSGKIYFVVEFKKDMDERGRSYSWSTLPAELNVMAGLDDNIVIDESDLSLYRSLLSHIQATDRRVNREYHPALRQLRFTKFPDRRFAVKRRFYQRIGSIYRWTPNRKRGGDIK